MNPDDTRSSGPLLQYGGKPFLVAATFVLVALLGTFPLQRMIAYPFVFLFFGAITGSAWFGGFIAGSMATVLSSVLVTYFFIPPFYSISIAKESQSYVTAYILCAIAITVVGSARKRADAEIRAARDELEERVQQRTGELQRSNLDLRERERQLRLLTEAIPQQIWRADAAGCVEYCNQDLLQYTGRRMDEAVGAGFLDMFHPEDASLFREGWKAASANGENFEIRTRVLGADGQYRWFLVRSVPERSGDDSVVRWYGVHIDIEEQQVAQQGLLEAQERLSGFTKLQTMAEMAASIAHELNQPLTALVTHASACRRWLGATPINVERALAAADRIVRDSERASAVVGRVRSLFSKSDYVRECTDLNQLIEDLARILRDDAIRRGVSLKLQLAEDLPSVSIDAVQIQQVLFNLAMNGMDAMTEVRATRVLEIRTEVGSKDEVVVTVKDHGRGFPDTAKVHMFEPFFTTKIQGTGMGLAICRSILEAHDGRIWLEEAEPGTVLKFVLRTGEFS